MADDDDALFQLLQPAPALPSLREPRLGAVGVKWTRYNGTHRPCDLCTLRVHELGVTGAPLPASAAHKRTGPNDTLLLCNVDAEELRRKDAEAERVRKARVEATGERPAARRGKTKTRQGMS
jgi:hypothetical protein